MAERPLCPLDVPEEVWNAVATHYNPQETWSPAPNYHVEYRDCRNAYLATAALLERRANGEAKEASTT